MNAELFLFYLVRLLSSAILTSAGYVPKFNSAICTNTFSYTFAIRVFNEF